MPSLRDLVPVPMRRVAVVAPISGFRRVAVEVADRGTFEPDRRPDAPPGATAAILDRLDPGDACARLSPTPEDPERLAAAGAFDLLLGEASLEERTAAARDIGRCRALPGWMRDDDLGPARETLAPLGAAVVDLPGRRGLTPPTAHAPGRTGDAFRPLVTTYAVVPYRDVDPTVFAAVAYLVMFGMMFGDVAHGLAIVALGAAATWIRSPLWRRLRPAGPFLLGAGVAATAFGFLYGEAFGPTGLVPTLWMRPLDEPETLLVAGLVLGAILLAITFAIATVDRWREGGPAAALYEPSGIAGSLLLLGAAGLALGWVTDPGWPTTAGWVAAGAGAALVLIGLVAESGGRPAGLARALIELFDTVLRLGSNIVSFTRLAAFGLTHAVITEVVWEGTTAWWDRGTPVTMVAAVVLFVAGNAAAFGLGALVAAIQALRLEYYELFSRLFVSSGRPFDPWHVPIARREES